jgi:hypothetical protein
VPRELVLFVSRLLARHRKEISTRKGTRRLGSHRYVAEARQVIAVRAPGLEEALQQAALHAIVEVHRARAQGDNPDRVRRATCQPAAR